MSIKLVRAGLAVIITTIVALVLFNTLYKNSSDEEETVTTLESLPSASTVETTTTTTRSPADHRQAVESQKNQHADETSIYPSDDANQHSDKNFLPPHIDAENTLARFGYPNISMKKRTLLKKRESIMKIIEDKDLRRHHIKNYDFFMQTTPYQQQERR